MVKVSLQRFLNKKQTLILEKKLWFNKKIVMVENEDLDSKGPD